MSDARPATAVVRIPFEDAAAAEAAARSLAPDNDGYLDARVEGGATLVLRAEAATAMGLLRSMSDALGCLRAISGP